jgi:hypothetical protein
MQRQCCFIQYELQCHTCLRYAHVSQQSVSTYWLHHRNVVKVGFIHQSSTQSIIWLVNSDFIVNGHLKVTLCKMSLCLYIRYISKAGAIKDLILFIFRFFLLDYWHNKSVFHFIFWNILGARVCTVVWLFYLFKHGQW